MELTVTFKSNNNFPINFLKLSNISLFDIDLIKIKINKEIDLDKVNRKPKKNLCKPLISVDKQNAKKINMSKFENVGLNHIEVIVPDGSLSKYIYKDVYVNKKDNNEIIETGIEYKINQEELLIDWINDGAPKFWGNPIKILSDKIKNKIIE